MCSKWKGKKSQVEEGIIYRIYDIWYNNKNQLVSLIIRNVAGHTNEKGAHLVGASIEIALCIEFR